MDQDRDEPLHPEAPPQPDEEQPARDAAEEEAAVIEQAVFQAVAQEGAPDPAMVEAFVGAFGFPDDGGFDQDEDNAMVVEEEEEDGRPFLEQFPDDDDAILDTTFEKLHQGKDIQGIPWETTPWSRAAYREKRNAEYSSYYNRETEVKAAAEVIKSQCLVSYQRSLASIPSIGEDDTSRYTFYRNWRRVRATIVHFQLRNLLWPVTSNQILYVANNRVMQWQNQTRKTDPRTILDLNVGSNGFGGGGGGGGGRITTVRTAPRVNTSDIDAMSVCTMCAKYGIVAAGGFGGELVVSKLYMDEMVEWKKKSDDENKALINKNAFGTRVTASENGITNAIDIYNSTSGTPSIVCSNNDQAVRLFDSSTLSPKGEFKLPWAVNYTAAHPLQGQVLCVVGDDPDAVLLDSTSGNKIATLRGHYDFSFAAAWSPDGLIVATGSQDLTTRVYDLRLTARPLCVLPAHMGAVRSLRYSPDGKTLAVAEPADYVTLYDVTNNYTTCQTVDVFGEIAGIGFSPDSKRFYISVSDVHYASLIQMNAARGCGENGARSVDEQWFLDGNTCDLP